VPLPVRPTKDPGRTAHHRAAHEHGVVGSGRPVVGFGCRVGALFQRIGLAGELGLIDEKVARFQQMGIGRNQVAGRLKWTPSPTASTWLRARD